MTTFRKDLSAPGLLSIIYQQFLKVPDPREFTKNVTISITDHLMCIFHFIRSSVPLLPITFRCRSDDAQLSVPMSFRWLLR